MSRICLNCQGEIKNDKAIFCYFCGSLMQEKSVVADSAAGQETATPQKNLSTKSKVPIITIPLLLLALSFGGLWSLKLGPFKASSQTASVSQVIIKEQRWKKQQINLSEKVPQFTFGAHKFELLIPFDINFYLEASNISLYLESDTGEKLQDFMSSAIGLSFEESMSFFEDDFSYFCQEESCGILLLPKEFDTVKKRLDEEYSANSKSDFALAFYGDFLLIYTNAITKEQVAEVHERLAKSIGMDSKFLESFKDVPEQGILFGYFTDPDAANFALEKSSLLNFSQLPVKEIEEAKTNFYVAEESGNAVLNY